jgi:general secretion pathway protein K
MKRQRGAAILTAMLTVVLVATLASRSLWQQWRGVEIEAAERSRTQAAWVLVGALDWARLILREDARKGGADHLAEPWAVPLAQARLSTFLAAERSDALAADDAPEAFLSGQIVDLQSRLNVTNLMLDGKINEPSQLAFTRLFKLLNLPATELALLADNLRLAQSSSAPSKAKPDPGVASSMALLPQDVDQLVWLGLPARSIAVLRPFITVLPERTPVNLNTAPVEVIYASVIAFELADAHQLVTARSTTHFAKLEDARQASAKTDAKLDDAALYSVTSRFFEVRGQLQLGQSTVQELSMVQRDGMEVKTLRRQRGVVPTAAPLQ